MTPIERLEKHIAACRSQNLKQGIVDIADLAAVLECVRAQHRWTERKNYAPTAYAEMQEAQKKVGLKL